MKKLSLVLVFAAACGAPSKAPVADDFSDLSEAKSDAFSKKLKLLGTLGYGQSATTSYTQTPIYRGWQFTAAQGDRLHITATSSVGDPVLWLLDAQYNVMA